MTCIGLLCLALTLRGLHARLGERDRRGRRAARLCLVAAALFLLGRLLWISLWAIGTAQRLAFGPLAGGASRSRCWPC